SRHPPSCRHSPTTTATAPSACRRTFCRASAITSALTRTNASILPVANSSTPTGRKRADRRSPSCRDPAGDIDRSLKYLKGRLRAPQVPLCLLTGTIENIHGSKTESETPRTPRSRQVPERQRHCRWHESLRLRGAHARRSCGHAHG